MPGPRRFWPAKRASSFGQWREIECYRPILILRSSEGRVLRIGQATLPEGMKVGSVAFFLVSSVAKILKQEGLRVFNLGRRHRRETLVFSGSRPGSVLGRIALEAASFCPKSVV